MLAVWPLLSMGLQAIPMGLKGIDLAKSVSFEWRLHNFRDLHLSAPSSFTIKSLLRVYSLSPTTDTQSSWISGTCEKYDQKLRHQLRHVAHLGGGWRKRKGVLSPSLQEKQRINGSRGHGHLCPGGAQPDDSKRFEKAVLRPGNFLKQGDPSLSQVSMDFYHLYFRRAVPSTRSVSRFSHRNSARNLTI